jgi:hypothetical protein
MYKDLENLEDLEVIKKSRIIKFKNKLFISWTVFIITTMIFFSVIKYIDKLNNDFLNLIPNILII